MSEFNMTRYFHFTLGPVQEFVAQARRTRDFWAGSFILSWLSAVAMLAVEQQGGKLLFPKLDDSLRDALKGIGDGGPAQGNVPNRFKAIVPAHFDPVKVENMVRTAWLALAELVWQHDLADYAQANTRGIWQQQIDAFWDQQWALVDELNAKPFDGLKRWRAHLPPDEPGVKCMMMDGWQELSGAERPGKEPEVFWQSLRSLKKPGMATDLRDGEMLCAVAFVKRRFARYFNQNFSIDLHAGLTLKGWKLPTAVPSVHYIAAAPWLAKLLQATQQKALSAQMQEFHDAAYQLSGDYGEWNSNIKCIRDVDVAHRWKALDGGVFFDAMVENSRLWTSASKAKEVLEKLKKLRNAADMEAVSPFYAVLMLDGDELGIQMGDPAKQQKITESLASFASQIPTIVDNHSGFLVYAGGDDVLALLPLEFALPCAAALRQCYASCFNGTGIPTTLSGAIEYAHIKMPLGKVLGDAHRLLDDIAKDTRGRDAIACRVWKPGGLVIEWAMPWTYALDEGQVVIDVLAQKFKQGLSGDEVELSNGFFYRIRERFELLNPAQHQDAAVLDEELALDFMAAEFLNSGLAQQQKMDMNNAKARIKPLLEQCRPVTRIKTADGQLNWQKSNRLEVDGALLVRFLATKGVDR